MRPFDLIIFGATGFTGRWVVEKMAKQAGKHSLKWAVASRNVDRLKRTMRELSTLSGQDLTQIPCLHADVEHGGSMRTAFGQARLLLNCIGPYTVLGDPVVRSCLDSSKPYSISILVLKLFVVQ